MVGLRMARRTRIIVIAGSQQGAFDTIYSLRLLARVPDEDFASDMEEAKYGRSQANNPLVATGRPLRKRTFADLKSLAANPVRILNLPIRNGTVTRIIAGPVWR